MIFRLVFSFVFFSLLMGCGRTKQEKVAEPRPKDEPTETITPPKKSDPTPIPEKKTVTPEINNIFKDVAAGEAFKHGELLITIVDVVNEKAHLNLYLGSQKYLSSSPVWLKFENKSKTKILDSPGWYGKGALKDEHENSFRNISLNGWKFYHDNHNPDYGERLNPLTTTYRSLYFEGIPITSKKFVLTLPLDNQIVRCKGILGENILLLEKKTNEEYVKKLAEKKEVMDKKEFELMKLEEKKRLEAVAIEIARKKELEDKGLPYYPLPKTTVKFLKSGPLSFVDADQAYKVILESKSLSMNNAALEALKDLKDEGVPFLLDLLLREPTTQGREKILINLYSANIHINDTQKIVDLLNKNKNQISTRIAALNLLAKGGNAKPFLEKIKLSTADLLLNKNVKEEVKGYIEKISR